MSDDKILLLQRRLEDHIDDFNKHKKEEDDRWRKLLEITQENSINIKSLAQSTHDVVEAWDTTVSVARAGSMLGRFVKWLSGFGIVVAAAAWILQHFNPPPGN